MKKLIIMMALVVSCASLQAANYVWGFQNSEAYVDASGNELTTGGTAFLYLGTVTASEAAFTTTGLTLLTYAGYDSDTEYYGVIDTGNALASELVTGEAGQDFSLILVDKVVTTLDDYSGNYILYTATSTQGLDPMSGDTWSEFMRNAEVTASDWSTMSGSPIPEPTSGLLLLLGMAGLALKRKIA